MVVELLIAGDQEPFMLLVEIVGKADIVEPLQNGPTAANAGITFGVIVMVSWAVVAH